MPAALSGKSDRVVSTWEKSRAPSQDQLLAQGFRFKGPEFTGSGGWISVEQWVHPTGKWIRLVDESGRLAGSDKDMEIVVPPPKCDPADTAELLKMTLDDIGFDLEENNTRQSEAIEAKKKMDTMHVNSSEFAEAYDNYVVLMDEGKRRIKEQLASLSNARDALQECGADLTEVKKGLDDLEELQHWFEVTRDLLDQEGRAPIRRGILSDEE